MAFLPSLWTPIAPYDRAYSLIGILLQNHDKLKCNLIMEIINNKYIRVSGDWCIFQH